LRTAGSKGARHERGQAVIDELVELYQTSGSRSYFGEPVTVTEHSLQAAALAEKSGANDLMIAAALLHDIGHLLHGLPEAVAGDGIDAMHEIVGGKWLSSRFSPDLGMIVSLHVAAKRFLCYWDEAYMASLSDASLQSLELQGGAMSATEASQFQLLPHWSDAVQLRRWDDQAKVRGQHTRSFESYIPLFTALTSKA
jgi:phosphonate degradation associated HDIG domain protein